MRRVLVVCYSLTGHTRQVAEMLAETCSADLELIEDEGGHRYNPFDLVWLSLKALLGQDVRLRPQQHNPAEYDLVLIGTPTWAGSMASPVRSYIKANLGHFLQIALFATEGGRNGERAVMQMAELARALPKAELVVTEPELKSGAFRSKAMAFLAELGLPEGRSAATSSPGLGRAA